MKTELETSLDMNPQFLRAYHLLENSTRSVFVTGRAGTGKSTLLKYFQEHTTKNVVVLAPTGVAAVNVKGQTIHSFFRFRPDIAPETVRAVRLNRTDREMYRNIDTIIIDEISMVRADLLDCVDRFLRLRGPDRRRPFGGVQMILIGDLFQLPPVVRRSEEEIFREIYASPYFFDAKVFQKLDLELVDLATIYRQQDDRFIAILNAIRNNAITESLMEDLNSRYLPDFFPPAGEFYVNLTTTNALADKINQSHLRRLPGRTFHYQGDVEGKFEEKNLPTHAALNLKIGAQVMLLNNDPQGRWINGSIGKIVAVAEDLTATDIIGVELENSRQVEVTPFTWEMFRFSFNEDTQALESEPVGAFRQYPIKLAWAVTIHKSQGKTFSKVVVDMGHGAFAHGQTYVALSRCTSLQGLVLTRPILQRHILLDERVVRFMESLQQMFSDV